MTGARGAMGKDTGDRMGAAGRMGAALLAACLALGGCVAPGGGTGAGSGSGSGAGSGTGIVAMFGGAMKAAAPAGYCIEPSASTASGEGAVVLMGRCAGAAATVAPALITVSLGGPGSSVVLQSGARALSDYFLSPAGRAALARDGRAGSVRVLQTSVAEGALMLRVADRTVGDYWRAILGLKGRLVTISVTAPDPDAGRRLLEAAMAAMRRANPG